MTTTTTPLVHDTTSIPGGRKTLALFWAPWQDESAPGGVCDAVLQALAASSSHADLHVCRIQAEECPEAVQQYNITAVPTFLLLDINGKVFERIEGSQDLSQVTRAVQKLLALPAVATDASSSTLAAAATTNDDSASAAQQQLKQRLQILTHAHPVMLFIKGTPEAPRCGFSKQAVQLLRDHDIGFGSFDILQDDAVRQGLKEYSDWPTYPQLYVNGELVGGLDIMKEFDAETTTTTSSFREQLGLSSATADTAASTTMTTTSTPGSSAPALSINDRLHKLVRQERIMLFMKGLPSAPQCGFSRQVVQLLQDHGIHNFGAFDILQDPDVRQGLKEYSDWPTYPQLYVNGELIGGLDIIQEMADDGTLEETLSG